MISRHGLHPLAAMLVAAAALGGCKKASPIPAPRVIERSMASASVSPRINHASTVLADGRVLVVGGWGLRQASPSTPASADELRDAVIYEPASDRWIPAASMAIARLRHSATTLADGRVLVVGGLNRDRTAAMSAEIFDPAAGAWKDAGGFTNGRDGHQAVRLDDGTVLIVGGMTSYAGAAERAETFDPRSARWQTAGSMPRPLYGHSLTALRGGQVLAIGGFSLLGGVTGECFLFDPGTRSWTATGKLRTGRYGHSATWLDDGRVVVAGGWNGQSLDSVEVYDPARKTWQPAGKLAQARHTHTATLTPGGMLLIAGGQRGSERQAGFYLTGAPVRSIEGYRPQLGASQDIGQLESPHFYHSASALPDGRILILGGLHDDRKISPVKAYGQLGYALVQVGS